MTKQNINTSEVRAEQAASKKLQTLKLGLDVHADTIVVVRILDNSAPQPAQKFIPAKFLDWIKTQIPLAEAVHTCYEAGPFGYGLHRALIQLGAKNLVVQPVCLDEHHKGVNHDKSDAKELAQRLDRYVAGNAHALATVRVPTPVEEQKRIQSRQREQLKREVLRVAAQGRSLLLTQGWREKKGWWEAGRRWTKLQLKLPVWLVERLECFRRVLTTLTTELEAAHEPLGLLPLPAASILPRREFLPVPVWGRHKAPVTRLVLDCGGKRSATPLLTFGHALPCESAVDASLRRRTPKCFMLRCHLRGIV
jgi:hypothetical protein